MSDEPKPRYVDTKTRYQGVFARHKLSCALAVDGDHCTCTPSYYGTVWDNAHNRNRRTKRVGSAIEARNRRTDLLALVRSGAAIPAATKTTFAQAHKSFIADCREGVALNKHGRPYKPNAITNP